MIQLQDIRKSFRTGHGTLDVLKGVNLEIQENSFTMLYGGSGSGKSTLLNVIGLLDTPSSGGIFWDDEDITACSASRRTELRRERIGFIFQAFHLIPVMTAFENVELPLGYAGIGKKQRRRMAEEALERVGLADRMHHLPGILSGGEQQRAAIARALVMNPQLILADEPTGNLDRETAEEIMAILKSLNAAIFMVTHDESLSQYADRTLFLKNGVIRSV